MPTVCHAVHDVFMGYWRWSYKSTQGSKVGKKMGINIFQWCRDMCSWTLINDPPIRLGGQGSIVQIDESAFTHQGKVLSKHK